MRDLVPIDDVSSNLRSRDCQVLIGLWQLGWHSNNKYITVAPLSFASHTFACFALSNGGWF